ncbi:aspartate:alanine exchanger family transporter [Corynebacterium uterequi]|uniref:Putative permease n=1 Tax=Corynebacterium uterequi TaxID=1072256 RepID=A0A0G3HDA5_9CORY|nr:TrkA C-terminal domain-containing protein [Corynebacterium uterequi]AKK11366.1 putative permease [Corynebacterium uterequi]
MTEVFKFFADQPILLVFLLVGLGMAFGSVKFRGVTLGAAAVLFTGIAFSAIAAALGVHAAVPHLIGILGLTLFAFGIGNNSGLTFFASLRTATGPILGLVGLFIAAAVIAGGLGMHLLGLDPSTVAGTFAGATTNTPALAAAGEVTGDEPTATIGYAVAYLFGVIGMIIAATVTLRDSANDSDAVAPVTHANVVVERDDELMLNDFLTPYGGDVQISRYQRADSDVQTIPEYQDRLRPGDMLTLVGSAEHLEDAVRRLGHRSERSLRSDRRQLDFRRITISQHALAGKTIAELDKVLAERWNARISRVRRADSDMVALEEFVVELGDRVRVVAPTENMKNISHYLGDSSKGLTDINPVALGLGLAIGVILGEIAVPMPGGGSFALGSAAGVLIVGLIMGRVGRIGPVVTALPHSANTVLSELGLLLFLAQAGTNAGGQIAGAFTGGDWWKILLLGVVITTFMAVGIIVVMRSAFGFGATKTSGVLGGAQTQPAVLAFANGRTNADPRVSLGYALVYPVAMIAKILTAHFLGMVLLMFV